jgi:pimeloyl-ACP methyl ester carboxylesterase
METIRLGGVESSSGRHSARTKRGLMDIVRSGRGNRFSLTALRPQYSRVDLTQVRRFDVPIVFMLGRHDWHAPAVPAARYFDTIEAPSKRLVWFEQSPAAPNDRTEDRRRQGVRHPEPDFSLDGVTRPF